MGYGLEPVLIGCKGAAMKIARMLALLGCVIMAASLTYGLKVGDFNREGSQILSLIWGQITMVDIYIAFALFGGWVIYREQYLWRGLLWLVGIVVLGSFTCCLYTYLALSRAQGDWHAFWLGARRHPLT
jgi:hypothetical protein